MAWIVCAMGEVCVCVCVLLMYYHPVIFVILLLSNVYM